VVPKGNLTIIVLILTTIPVLGFVVASIPLFRHHPELTPRLDCFDWNYGRQILTKGIGFFFIQITSCLVIFGSSNLFITQFVGPEAVTTYNIAYKYFNLLAIAYTIVISPMWNAYTDAYVKGDYAWIRITHKRALTVWGITIVGGLAMLAISGIFYQLWVGSSISVPLSVSVCVFAYISFYNLNNCATMLINGLNKIRVQIITSVVFTLLYIAAVSQTGRQGGIEGVVICMAASYAIMAAIHLYQCRLLINKKAKGIWNQ
jgi:O-antigen/teichoic acid export membrane protein